jgi:hypothetical protein
VRAWFAPPARLIEQQLHGERFSYVIIATGATFDLHGRKSALKKGDRMEFAAAARALALEVDVAYYMVSYVVGLCARFINGDAAFQPPANARLTEKNIDELSQKAAKKSLEATAGKLIETHTSGHIFAEDLRTLITTLNPRHVIPVHTNNPEKFQELHAATNLLPDGVPLNL